MIKREGGGDLQSIDHHVLTIVSVCLAKHYAYIQRQIELIDYLNPNVPWRMIVVDNACAEGTALKLDDRRCQVINGVPLDLNKPENCRGSYHHAAGLNKALAEVRTRFLLVLDPDLFVIYRNWINESIQHMIRNRLSFFGAPWHPRWYSKYRYFPCVHFLMIDLEKVDIGAIDFMPALVEKPPFVYRIDRLIKQAQIEKQPRTMKLKPIINAVGIRKALLWSVAYWIYHGLPLLFSRYRIHSSRDTGWRLWNDFGRTRRHSADMVLPVVDVQTQLIKPAHLQTRWGICLERLLPRRWSFLPAVGTYVNPKQAPAFDLPEFSLLKPEAFVWRGSPFAFHLRRYLWDTVMGGRDAEEEDHILERLFATMKIEPCWFLWGKALRSLSGCGQRDQVSLRGE